MYEFVVIALGWLFVILNVKFSFLFLLIQKSVVPLQCISKVIHYDNMTDKLLKYNKENKNINNKKLMQL